VTNKVTASAAGKVVLCGEYAVLDGAPAICMAVNRRARVVINEIDSNCSEVRAPGLTDIVGRFKSVDGRIQWQDGQAVFGVVDAVLNAVGFEQTAALSIDLDTIEFVDSATQRKLGIGSSAAITVALCAAIAGSVDPAALIALAQRAHTDLQKGAGSGVDIACSLSGGLIEYRMEGASVTALKWPEGLSYRLLWSGVAASTREKLSKLAASVSKPSRNALVGASRRLALAWRSNDAKQLIAEYRDYCQQLLKFSVDHELGIFDAGHAELWRAASAAGLIYKPCGAGGGDIGILLGMDEVQLDAFAGKYSTNCSVLDCEMSPTGVRIGA
jgi:phosphomevalonate kinase